ncbi:MAG: sugar dehydrogenase, partial [Acidobacteriota bacterium]
MRTLIAAIVMTCLCLVPDARAAVELETVLTGLGAPVALTHAGDDRLFITEIGGVVRIVVDDQLVAEPFLNISARVNQGGGRGLWSVAF